MAADWTERARDPSLELLLESLLPKDREQTISLEQACAVHKGVFKNKVAIVQHLQNYGQHFICTGCTLTISKSSLFFYSSLGHTAVRMLHVLNVLKASFVFKKHTTEHHNTKLEGVNRDKTHKATIRYELIINKKNAVVVSLKP